MMPKPFSISSKETEDTYSIVFTLLWIITLSFSATTAYGVHITTGFGIAGNELIIGLSKWRKG